MIRRHFVFASAACLAFAAVAAPAAHEQELIDKLIAFVKSRTDTVFIRNGKEYDNDEAATFLRRKLESMGRDVTTAREFIDRIASKSSMSGKPYHVKLGDGSVVLASRFLGDELERLQRLPA